MQNTPFYTNELTPDVLACQDKSPFSAEQFGEMANEGTPMGNGFLCLPQGC